VYIVTGTRRASSECSGEPDKQFSICMEATAYGHFVISRKLREVPKASHSHRAQTKNISVYQGVFRIARLKQIQLVCVGMMP
jgi:hypothetical protein